MSAVPHPHDASVQQPWITSKRIRRIAVPAMDGPRTAFARSMHRPWILPRPEQAVQRPRVQGCRTRMCREPNRHGYSPTPPSGCLHRPWPLPEPHARGGETLLQHLHTIHGCYHDRMPRSRYVHPDAARFGAIVQGLRLARGWTLVKFAQRSGMNATYLGVLEKGGNMPSLQTIFELADVFNIEASELVRRVEEARRPAPPAAPD